MGANIREITEGDADAVASLRVLSWQHTYRGMVPQDFLDRLRPEQMADRLRAQVRSGLQDQVHLVAEAAGSGIVGWANIGPYRPIPEVDGPPAASDAAPGAPAAAGEGELYALYLRPEYTGQGLGRELLHAALGLLEAQGHSRVLLWVLRDNVRARRFYERAGFTADGSQNVLQISGAPVPEVRYVRG